MKFIVAIIFLICFQLFLIYNVYSKTYFISSSGNDNNSGISMEEPWSSIGKVNSANIEPGDTVSFKGEEIFNGPVIRVFKTDDNIGSIVFNSYGKGSATIKSMNSGPCLELKFNTNISLVIRNLKIAGNYNPDEQKGAAEIGIYCAGSNRNSSNSFSNIIITDCDISNFKTAGISILSSDFAKVINTTIENNVIHDIGENGITFNFIWNSNSKISRNRIYNIKGLSNDKINSYSFGIQINFSNNIICERNQIHDIGKYSFKSGVGIETAVSKSVIVRLNEIYGINTLSKYDAQAIDFEHGSDSCISEYNFIHDNPGAATLISGSTDYYLKKVHINNMKGLKPGFGDNNIVRYNIFKQCGTNDGIPVVKISSGTEKNPGLNNQITDNIIIKKGTQKDYIFGFDGWQKGTQVKNNIIIADMVSMYLIDDANSKINMMITGNFIWENDDYDKILNRTEIFKDQKLNPWIKTLNSETLNPADIVRAFIALKKISIKENMELK